MDPIRPKRSQFFSNILYVTNILHDSIGRSLKGRCRGRNCLKRPQNGKNDKCCNRIIRPNLYNTVKYAFNTIQRITRIRHMTHPWCSQSASSVIASTKLIILYVTHNTLLCQHTFLQQESRDTTHRGQPNRKCIGLAQNHIYTVYIRYFCREITKYTVIYGKYIRFWPTLEMHGE